MKEGVNMCLAIPAQIISITDERANIDILGVMSVVNVQLIESPQIGDYVLVHAGCAIQKIDTRYFEELEKILHTLLEEDDE
jgi:hydrogenase expression/formation protein HypC